MSYKNHIVDKLTKRCVNCDMSLAEIDKEIRNKDKYMCDEEE